MKSPCQELQYFGRANGYDFWFSPECPVSQEAMQQILAGAAATGELLKHDAKRLVYIGGEKQKTRFVVKVNLLPRCKDRLRARRFAPQECQSHALVAKSGLSVPLLWGYFRRRRYGITLCNGMVISCLEEARNLSIAEGEAAIPLLAQLQQKGINHPDFMRNNIMLSGPEKKPVLIDLERCSFVAPGDFRLPLMHLARFIEYNEIPFADPINQSLIHKSYDALSAPPVSRESFHHLLAMFSTRHLTTRERVGLLVPADIKQKLKEFSNK